MVWPYHQEAGFARTSYDAWYEGEGEKNKKRTWIEMTACVREAEDRQEV